MTERFSVQKIIKMKPAKEIQLEESAKQTAEYKLGITTTQMQSYGDQLQFLLELNLLKILMSKTPLLKWTTFQINFSQWSANQIQDRQMQSFLSSLRSIKKKLLPSKHSVTKTTKISNKSIQNQGVCLITTRTKTITEDHLRLFETKSFTCSQLPILALLVPRSTISSTTVLITLRKKWS